MKKERNVYLYVETTSDEAVSLIEALSRVESARLLLKHPSFEMAGVKWDETSPSMQALQDLERELRARMRNTILQPNPVRVSKHLADRIRNEIKKEEGNGL